MPKAQFSHDFIRRVTAEPSGQKTVYYCEEITGFIVEVRPRLRTH